MQYAGMSVFYIKTGLQGSEMYAQLRVVASSSVCEDVFEMEFVVPFTLEQCSTTQ